MGFPRLDLGKSMLENNKTRYSQENLTSIKAREYEIPNASCMLSQINCPKKYCCQNFCFRKFMLYNDSE